MGYPYPNFSFCAFLGPYPKPLSISSPRLANLQEPLAVHGIVLLFDALVFFLFLYVLDDLHLCSYSGI